MNIATAHVLKEKIQKDILLPKPYYIITNGVDAERMKKAKRLPEYDFTKGTLQIGYFGHLTDAWFDWELIQQLAKNHMDWTFHMIGYGAPEKLRVPNNVILYGKKLPEELPKYAAYWDVAIIPFINNELTKGVNPIKVFEYLQLRLPVVASNMPEIAEYPYVSIAIGYEEFEAAIVSSAEIVMEEEKVQSFIENMYRGAGERRRTVRRVCRWRRHVPIRRQPAGRRPAGPGKRDQRRPQWPGRRQARFYSGKRTGRSGGYSESIKVRKLYYEVFEPGDDSGGGDLCGGTDKAAAAAAGPGQYLRTDYAVPPAEDRRIETAPGGGRGELPAGVDAPAAGPGLDKLFDCAGHHPGDAAAGAGDGLHRYDGGYVCGGTCRAVDDPPEKGGGGK